MPMSNTSSTSDNLYQFLLTHLQDVIRALSNHANTVSNELQQINTGSARIQTSLQIIEQNSASRTVMYEDIRSQIDAMKFWQNLHEQQIMSLKQAFIDASSTSYDGSSIWKITNVHDKTGMLSDAFTFHS